MPQPSKPNSGHPLMVFTVLFQFGECCNSLGAFKSRKDAMDWIGKNAIFSMMNSGIVEYGKELVTKYQMVMQLLPELHFKVRDRFNGSEIWLDLMHDETDIQPAMFTITRHRIGGEVRTEEQDLKVLAAIPIRHPTPEAVQ